MNDDDTTARIAAIATMRDLFCAGRLTAGEIAAALGTSRSTVFRTARREGWPRRRRLRFTRPAGPAPPEGGHVDRRAMAARLERLVSSRMASIEASPVTDVADGERQARTLAHLARTASTVRTYLGTLNGEDDRDDDVAPPRSLSELRDELRRHLERIREEERRPQLRGGAEPD